VEPRHDLATAAGRHWPPVAIGGQTAKSRNRWSAPRNLPSSAGMCTRSRGTLLADAAGPYLLRFLGPRGQRLPLVVASHGTRPLVNDTDTIKRSIVDAHGTRVFVRTNGQADLLEFLSRRDDSATEVAELVDLAVASLQRLGEELRVGELQDVVLRCGDGVIVLGRGALEQNLAVVADGECNVGLLINHVRRLMSHTEQGGTPSR
jgi:predicted regulator of Ras-like GTPase activity (Roadblock/LC7/MglB family)